MTGSRPSPLAAAIELAYATFAAYPTPVPGMFCTHCYTADEAAALTTTALRAVSTEQARTLLWETGDHWGSAADYKHYLPRLLEAMAPPEQVEDMYPAHLFEVLAHHDVAGWPAAERRALHGCLTALADHVAFHDPDDEAAWWGAVAALATDGIVSPHA